MDKYGRCKGGLYGLLVGDALGVPYEFHSAEQIPPYDKIEMKPPLGFCRAHSAVKPGTWSDDGAQALCLLDSLITCGEFQLKDFQTDCWRGIRKDCGQWAGLYLTLVYRQVRR